MEKTDLKKTATPREIVLFSILFIALISAFVRTFYGPLQDKTKELKIELKEMNTQKQELDTQMNSLVKLQNQKQAPTIDSPKSKVQMLKGKINPIFTDLPRLLEHFSNPQVLSGATITGFSAKSPVRHDGYMQISLTFSAKGSFQEITNFLENMEKTQALVALESISLAKVPEVEGEMDSQITANLYEVEGIHAL